MTLKIGEIELKQMKNLTGSHMRESMENNHVKPTLIFQSRQMETETSQGAAS